MERASGDEDVSERRALMMKSELDSLESHKMKNATNNKNLKTILILKSVEYFFQILNYVCFFSLTTKI